MATAEKGRQSVAIIGSGMAGLVAAYLLRTDRHHRFDVEIFEKQNRLSLDSASLTVSTQHGTQTVQDRIDLPMRVFASGFYENLKRMYDYFGIRYASPRFIYTLSAIPEDAPNAIHPHFIHSSNNHQMPPLRPERSSWATWLIEVLYLAICYYYFTACCFFVKPREADASRAAESFREYMDRINLPRYYVQRYVLPLMSSVTTCPHNVLLDFPAIDIVDYETKTFRKPHYTVVGGVNRVQAKLSEGQKVTYGAAVTAVENVGSKVQVTWKNEQTGSVESRLFDQAIMAVTPDVVGAIFPPLKSAMTAIPTTYVGAVVHRDYARLSTCNRAVEGQVPSDYGRSQLIHMSSTASDTESTHHHPSSALITTAPIVPIDPATVLHRVTFTRVLRTPTSRQLLNEIFNERKSWHAVEKPQCQWRNGDGNVWLVGGWCWDGMVMLEGCIASALRVANKLDIEVPWAMKH
ncbi:uncharacterized protein N7459_009880 [Penicillium hispanicum]|uniref:uncharacterized protein n=1 Tax=Penicillium hispanicum TaxID=1080232 RepID=UPI0025404D05|nr:uncharacterized protein N7459_009880 [Penicillium hispanicum]KAJ5570450.1 hypothetical protein N7459_009880 [Penicillium hispanicum]